jgi:hypothetical protein
VFSFVCFWLETFDKKFGKAPAYDESLVQFYALFTRAREILTAYSQSLTPEQIAAEEKRRLDYRRENADYLLLTTEEITHPPKVHILSSLSSVLSFSHTLSLLLSSFMSFLHSYPPSHSLSSFISFFSFIPFPLSSALCNDFLFQFWFVNWTEKADTEESLQSGPDGLSWRHYRWLLSSAHSSSEGDHSSASSRNPSTLQRTSQNSRKWTRNRWTSLPRVLQKTSTHLSLDSFERWVFFASRYWSLCVCVCVC